MVLEPTEQLATTHADAWANIAPLWWPKARNEARDKSVSFFWISSPRGRLTTIPMLLVALTKLVSIDHHRTFFASTHCRDPCWWQISVYGSHFQRHRRLFSMYWCAGVSAYLDRYLYLAMWCDLLTCPRSRKCQQASNHAWKVLNIYQWMA